MKLLDSSEFPAFEGLLEACNSYASFTGARFDPEDFALELGRKPRVTERPLAGFAEARAEAAAAVLRYVAKKDDDDVRREYEVAYRRTVHEAALSAMVAALKELDALPEATAIKATDLTADDVRTDNLKRLAKKLKKISETRDAKTTTTTTVLAKLRAASFVADFGVAVGLPRFDCPDDDAMVRAFYQKLQVGEDDGTAADVGKKVDCVLADSLAPFFDLDAVKRWARTHPEEATGIALVGAGIVGLSIALFTGLQHSHRRGRSD